MRVRKAVTLPPVGTLAPYPIPQRLMGYRLISLSVPITTVLLSLGVQCFLQVLDGTGAVVASYVSDTLPVDTLIQLTFVSGLGYFTPAAAILSNAVVGIGTETFIREDMTMLLTFDNTSAGEVAAEVIMLIEEDEG